ncbi:MAG: class I SAM-dependent methyltransferase [Candidatus Moduliflexus flocculans]|nr:class I SAM-dependent methyltransferase [Candidatus Moduliflexus flocculans]
MTGLDLSADMLARARRKLASPSARITLIQWRYDQPLDPQPAFDLIVFSYCLSMINPGWERAVDSALRDLRPGGRLAVVDFHETRFHAFQRWMAVNHVRMDGHLLPCLNAHCQPVAPDPGRGLRRSAGAISGSSGKNRRLGESHGIPTVPFPVDFRCPSRLQGMQGRISAGLSAPVRLRDGCTWSAI